MMATLEGSAPGGPRKVARIAATVVVVAVCVGIAGIGVRFLVAPEVAASGFGLTGEPDDPYLAVKGVRDIGSGLIILAVLLTARLRVVAWALLAAAVIPLGDMSVVLTHGGPVAIALGVHGATCLVMVAAAVTLLLTAGAEPHESGRNGRAGTGGRAGGNADGRRSGCRTRRDGVGWGLSQPPPS